VKRSTRVSVRVVPGSRRAGVEGRYGSGWKVRVVAAPERGAANDALVRVLAETVGVGRQDVRIVSGHTARDKIVELLGVSPAEIDSRLESAERKEAR
jgi:uncharacterized protein YggU (UPF0235/DUF167 family)